jgi:hypothetical protein
MLFSYYLWDFFLGQDDSSDVEREVIDFAIDHLQMLSQVAERWTMPRLNNSFFFKELIFDHCC